MKLMERELGLELELQENRVAVLVIEDAARRFSLVGGLYAQSCGQEGSWLLAENEKIFALSKKCQVILEPFSLEINGKKLLTKLYQEIKEIADEDCYVQSMALHANICGYLEALLEKLPYPLRYDDAWDVSNLLKMCAVRLPDEYDSHYERLRDYIDLMNRACGTQLFVLVNMKPFLTEGQIQDLYKMASYSKIFLVLVEFGCAERKYPEEDICVLDADTCIITY